MMPDILLHPPIWAILRNVTSFAPPIVLAGIGFYFIFLKQTPRYKPLESEMSVQPTPQQIALLQASALFDEGALVDAYGKLKAEAAAVEAKLEAIKAALQATGKDQFRTGVLFDATMSISEGRETVSPKTLRAALGADAERFIRRGKDVYTLRCTSKVS